MNKTPTIAKSCWLSAIILTLAGVILRTVAMFVCFDTQVGYFDASPLSFLLTALSFAAVLLPVILCIIIPKATLPSVWPELKHTPASILPFAAFIAFGIWTTLLVANQELDGKFPTVIAIFAFVSAFYYFLTLCHAKGKPINTQALAAVGYAPILWGLMSVAETYTDQFTTMNSPVKLSLQFGFLGVMLLTVSELRFLLKKAMPRTALCFHCIALYFCLSGSIPTLIAYATGILKRNIHGAYALALLGMGIYALIRLIAYMTLSAPRTSADGISKETDASADINGVREDAE